MSLMARIEVDEMKRREKGTALFEEEGRQKDGGQKNGREGILDWSCAVGKELVMKGTNSHEFDYDCGNNF